MRYEYWDGSRPLWHCDACITCGTAVGGGGVQEHAGGRHKYIRCDATGRLIPRRCPQCGAFTAETRTWDLSPKARSDKDRGRTLADRDRRKEWPKIKRMKRRVRELSRKYKTTGKLTKTEWERLQKLDAELMILDDARLRRPPAGLGKPDPVSVEVIPRLPGDNPFGWTEIESEIVRMHEIEGLGFREIGRRRGRSHVAVMKSYRNAKEKAEVVTPDTPVREGEGEEDRILMLVFRHGLDGYAATVAADDPKVYALFETEVRVAA